MLAAEDVETQMRWEELIREQIWNSSTNLNVRPFSRSPTPPPLPVHVADLAWQRPVHHLPMRRGPLQNTVERVLCSGVMEESDVLTGGARPVYPGENQERKEIDGLRGA